MTRVTGRGSEPLGPSMAAAEGGGRAEPRRAGRGLFRVRLSHKSMGRRRAAAAGHGRAGGAAGAEWGTPRRLRPGLLRLGGRGDERGKRPRAPARPWPPPATQQGDHRRRGGRAGPGLQGWAGLRRGGGRAGLSPPRSLRAVRAGTRGTEARPGQEAAAASERGRVREDGSPAGPSSGVRARPGPRGRKPGRVRRRRPSGRPLASGRPPPGKLPAASVTAGRRRPRGRPQRREATRATRPRGPRPPPCGRRRLSARLSPAPPPPLQPGPARRSREGWREGGSGAGPSMGGRARGC
ncbi:uncharacterized protein LOC144456732 isoform X1 [Phascolarctos cinereus]